MLYLVSEQGPAWGVLSSAAQQTLLPGLRVGILRPVFRNPQPLEKLMHCCKWMALLMATRSLCLAGETPERADKSGYHLFKPVPRELMRELSTDRPDKTESAYTVDAGHFQIESDLATYAHDKDTRDGNDIRTSSWSIGSLNLKAGICNRVDLQWVVDTYSRVRTDDRNNPPVLRQRGFGDLQTRLKVNLWGNDGGRTAAAVMPFVKYPTASDNLGNKAYEGGVILPLALDLGRGWGMGIMTEFDFNENGSGSGHHAEFVNSITVSHDIVGALGGYVEFWSLVPNDDDAPWVGTVDLGLTYGLTDNIQLDAGVNLGVTQSAEDVNPFLGITFRF